MQTPTEQRACYWSSGGVDEFLNIFLAELARGSEDSPHLVVCAALVGVEALLSGRLPSHDFWLPFWLFCQAEGVECDLRWPGLAVSDRSEAVMRDADWPIAEAAALLDTRRESFASDTWPFSCSGSALTYSWSIRFLVCICGAGHTVSASDLCAGARHWTPPCCAGTHCEATSSCTGAAGHQ